MNNDELDSGRKRVREDGDRDNSDWVGLNSGQCVPWKEALEWTRELLVDLYLPLHDGERLLAALHKAAAGRPWERDLPPLSRKLIAKYFGPGGKLKPVVRSLVGEGAQWREDRLVLKVPFIGDDHVDLYLAMRKLWSKQYWWLPASPPDDGDQAPAQDSLAEARDKDTLHGKVTVLTNGTAVPVETAMEVLFWIECPDPQGRLEADLVVTLWKFCHGQEVPKGDRQFYVDCGFADQDGNPDSIVQGIVQAAVRWDGDRLTITSPFAEEAVRRRYVRRCSEAGFTPAPSEARRSSADGTEPAR